MELIHLLSDRDVVSVGEIERISLYSPAISAAYNDMNQIAYLFFVSSFK
jgi:hypothetical protein